ncbi:MAG: acetyl-CoA carboxylase biotin carboxyl carrier protein [Alphaproteobacteria bacterium]
MSDKIAFDADVVRQLAELLDETSLNEIEYESSDARIRVVRHNEAPQVVSVAQQPMATGPAPVVEVPPVPSAGSISAISTADHPGAIKSPMVGNVYLAPEPGAANFVSVGDEVKVGDTLLIIEAMKVMNPIKATSAGKVTQILINDGDPVEFDEPIIIIE